MTASTKKITVLTVGGLDPTGAAGILLDVAAIRSVGVHGAAVMAVSTVQNGRRFVSSKPEDPQHVRLTIERILENLQVRAVKTGALGCGELVDTVALLAAHPNFPPLVVDPVIKSTTGGVLLDDKGVSTLREHLLPKVSLITPNVDEAELLSGFKISNLGDMKTAASRIIELGAKAVLVKGGHLEGTDLTDIFTDHSGMEKVFVHKRIGSRNVRGTGCALASLIAAQLGKGQKMIDAVEEAGVLLRKAMEHAQPIDNGPPILRFPC